MGVSEKSGLAEVCRLKMTGDQFLGWVFCMAKLFERLNGTKNEYGSRKQRSTKLGWVWVMSLQKGARFTVMASMGCSLGMQGSNKGDVD